MQLYNDVFSYLETRSAEINVDDPNVYITKLDPNERFLCQMTHLHAQVFNGGIMQWEYNGYAERDLKSLRSMSEPIKILGIYDEVKPFFDFLKNVEIALMHYRDARDVSEPDMWDYEGNEEGLEDAWSDYEGSQDRAGDSLDALDTTFYSEETVKCFNTVLKAFFEMT